MDLLNDDVTRPMMITAIVLHVSQQFCGINAVFYYSTTFFEGVIDNPLLGRSTHELDHNPRSFRYCTHVPVHSVQILIQPLRLRVHLGRSRQCARNDASDSADGFLWPPCAHGHLLGNLLV